MGKLADFAASQSKYIRIAPGMTIEVKFLGFKFVPSRWEDEGETIRYTFELAGEEKTFESKSLALAESMDKFEIGETVTIKRTGEGTKTKYKVKRAGEKDTMQDEEEVIVST